jgi:hypothetical protein
MVDLPTKELSMMNRSAKTDYETLESVAKQYLDKDIGVKLSALLKLINGKIWSLRNFAKKQSIKVSILSDSKAEKYVFFFSEIG